MTILTVGHSNRSLEDFVGLLQAHGVRGLVDVRTIPRSAHNPQFNRETLPVELKKAGLAYEHMPGLGGLRHSTRDSQNTGWRNASFRGFADYMQTAAFEAALQELISRAKRGLWAIMCAESVPWRCHRSLIADALLVRGIQCEHITSRTRRQPHRMTPFAQVRQGHICYPPAH
jgi:uncharacterized protein (DUF488 family)